MAQVVPGWYPYANNPEVYRYWDGNSWTAWSMTMEALAARGTSPMPTMPQAPRPTLGRYWNSLALIVQSMLLLSAVAGAAGTAVYFWAWQTAGAWDLATVTGDDVANADRIDRLVGLSYVTDILLLLVGGLLMMVWLFEAHRSDRMNPAALHFSSGWAFFGWFVPFLALWRPLQIVRDVARGSRGSDGSVPSIVGWWWACWIAASLALGVVGLLAPLEDDDPDRYLAGIVRQYAAQVGSEAIWTMAAILALLMVRRVTKQVLAAVPANTA